MEAGLRSIGIDPRKIAARYIEKVLLIQENRWPFICLKEKSRSIRNQEAAGWGKSGIAR